MKENKKITGFNCPNCDTFVSISLKILLSNATLSCPNCNTKFEIDKQEPMEAMQKLNTVNDKKDKTNN
ncbi:MAG: hypothetical protein GYB35_03040 [Algicola sp.]|nr:hypothetical protein [Algicola sp.]